MNDYLKTMIIRTTKLLHFLVHIAAFFWFPLSQNLSLKFSIGNAPLTNLVIFSILLLFSLRTYSGYAIGIARLGMLFYSQFMALLVCDVLMYLLIALELLAFPNILPFLCLLCFQLAWNLIWCFCVTKLYFILHTSCRTVIICGREDSLNRLHELDLHKKKFQVEKVIHLDHEDIHALIPELHGFEAVFIVGVHATLRNGIVKHCVDSGTRCFVSPHIGDILMMGASHVSQFSSPIFRITRASPNVEYSAAKRALDIFGSLSGIVILSPLMLLTALAIKLYDGGPAIYKQVRLTKNGKKFYILKFRSMKVNAEGDGVARLASANDNRITPIGKVIRACRIDELPQLFNILRGDMSIVGPRPERPEIAAQYEKDLPAFSLRLQVRAGLTGYAQIYGRYNTTPYDKLQMDLIYINKMSFTQDLKLIFATLKILFMKESTSGVSEGQTTAASQAEKSVVK